MERIAAVAPSDIGRLMLELAAGELPDVVVFGPGVTTEAALALAAHVDERHHEHQRGAGQRGRSG